MDREQLKRAYLTTLFFVTAMGSTATLLVSLFAFVSVPELTDLLASGTHAAVFYPFLVMVAAAAWYLVPAAGSKIKHKQRILAVATLVLGVLLWTGISMMTGLWGFLLPLYALNCIAGSVLVLHR